MRPVRIMGTNIGNAMPDIETSSNVSTSGITNKISNTTMSYLNGIHPGQSGSLPSDGFDITRADSPALVNAREEFGQNVGIYSNGEKSGTVAFNSSNKKSIARFFGRRPQESAAKSNAAQIQANAELAAASNISNNPNNPEFFRRAAVENTTAQIHRQPRQINKKPFIIGAIAIVIAALVVVSISFFPKYIANLHSGDAEKLKAEAFAVNDDLAFYETRFEFLSTAKSININTFRISSEALSAYKMASEERLTIIDTFYNNIKNYSIEGEKATYLDYLKEKLPARIELYKKYDQFYIGMSEAFQGSSSEVEGKIGFTSGYDKYTDVVKVIKTGLDSKTEIDKKWKEWNCNPNAKGDIPERCVQLLDQDEYVSSYFAKNGDITAFMKSAFKDVTADHYINECTNRLSDENIKEVSSDEEKTEQN